MLFFPHGILQEWTIVNLLESGGLVLWFRLRTSPQRQGFAKVAGSQGACLTSGFVHWPVQPLSVLLADEVWSLEA